MPRTGTLRNLYDEYDDIQEQLDECSDPKKKLELLDEFEMIKEAIDDCLHYGELKEF